MEGRAPTATPGPSSRTPGRVAGIFLWVGAGGTVANALASDSSGRRLVLELVLAAAVAAFGGLAQVVPWERWSVRAPLALLPVGFVSLCYSNYATPQPYLVSVSFVVIAVWIGLFQPRHTSAILAPLLALAFWLPLQAGSELPGLGVATLVVTGVSVAVGESLASLRARLDRAQGELLAGRERRFATLVERSGEVVIVFDTSGTITYVSPSSLTTFGYDPSEMEGRPVLEFTAANVDQEERPSWAALLDDAEETTAQNLIVETRIRHADGRWIEVETIGQDRTDDPDIGGFVYNIRDIHARKELERRLRHQAFFDELTGLPNRAHLLAHLRARMAAGHPSAVLFVDLDGFKMVNDSAGHDVGDELLKVVGDRLRSIFSTEGSLLARFGGDEFVAVVPTDRVEAGHALAAEVVAALGQPLRVGLRKVSIAASIGLATGRDAADPEDVIRAADIAMYVAKGSVDERIAVFEPWMRADLVARLTMEADLRRALEAGQFRLHYQPLIDLADGRPVGAEALLRWEHPTGRRAPGAFIDVAESAGLIVPLGRWVLQEACAAAARWPNLGARPPVVAVNVSPRQFQDPALITDVTDALDLSGLDPARLKIEVTESVLLADVDAARKKLDRLSALGVRLALDDFGTGYSSLSYLQTLPFHVLKVDKSFIDHIATRPRDGALARTINQLGHDLGLITLAEGVETADQAAAVAEIGVDHAQGYHWSPPVPEDDLLAYFAASTEPATLPGPA